MKTLLKLAVVMAWALLQVNQLTANELASEISYDEFDVATGTNTFCDGSCCDCLCCCDGACGGQQKPWSLFSNWQCLQERGIQIGGYIQQSAATDSRNPTNPAAGFGTWPGGGFLYRNDEYNFNRLYLTLDRPTNTGGCGWDFGGKVDFLYGTDYVFLQARGLETRGDLSAKWNSGRGVGFGGVGLMGLAMPQIYGEVAHNDVSVKLGHFYHPGGFTGFDPVKGVLGNTNTYTLIYASILPVTGALAQWQASDRLTVGGGVHRGSANWEDNNDKLSAVGFVNWKFCNDKGSFKYVFDIGPEDAAGEQTEYYQSVVLDWKFCDRWTYVFQSHYRHVKDGVSAGMNDNYYSVVNRLAYEINEKTIVGVRYEWFDDTNGNAVFPNSPGAGVWHGLSIGGTYKHCPNVWLRPQIRWDWFDADPGVAPGPWGDGTERSRFIASFSLFTFL